MSVVAEVYPAGREYLIDIDVAFDAFLPEYVCYYSIVGNTVSTPRGLHRFVGPSRYYREESFSLTSFGPVPEGRYRVDVDCYRVSRDPDDGGDERYSMRGLTVVAGNAPVGGLFDDLFGGIFGS